MTLIYRVRFVRPCTEAAAREVVEGINGGNVRGVRTADDGTNTTAWFSVGVNEDAGDEAIDAFIDEIDAELTDDSRVGGFSSTELV
jgi:hypothetical protein